MKKIALKSIAVGAGIFVVLFVLLTGIRSLILPSTAVFSYDSGIDISEDVREGVPYFYQWDKRWSGLSYGSSNMKDSGCGPTCLSMVWCGLTGKTDWDPYTVAKMAEEKGYYVPGAGTSWELMTEGAKVMGLQAEELPYTKGSILNALKNGTPVICAVGPGDFTTEGHFIVLAGVDENERLLVHDPNSEERSSQTWEVERVMKQVKNLWVFSR